MPEFVLAPPDILVIAPLLVGCERPKDIRLGTWHHLTKDPELLILEAPEWRALVELEPRVLNVLGLAPTSRCERCACPGPMQ